jgi:hypothetical protein
LFLLAHWGLKEQPALVDRRVPVVLLEQPGQLAMFAEQLVYAERLAQVPPE